MNLKGTSEVSFCDENVSIYFTSIFSLKKTHTTELFWGKYIIQIKRDRWVNRRGRGRIFPF